MIADRLPGAMLDLRLPVDLQAAREARYALDELSEEIAPQALESVRLLISELVTNTVLHAGVSDEGWIGVRIESSGERVRVEVTDAVPIFERRRLQLSNRVSGWGLYLVDRTADRWGLVRDEATHVWFEIDVRPGR